MIHWISLPWWWNQMIKTICDFNGALTQLQAAAVGHRSHGLKDHCPAPTDCYTRLYILSVLNVSLVQIQPISTLLFPGPLTVHIPRVKLIRRSASWHMCSTYRQMFVELVSRYSLISLYWPEQCLMFTGLPLSFLCCKFSCVPSPLAVKCLFGSNDQFLAFTWTM